MRRSADPQRLRFLIAKVPASINDLLIYRARRRRGGSCA
jgi:hypothetical protein